MTNARKVKLLHQKAHGKEMDASPAEQKELRKYKVYADDGNYATMANIREYIKAVDSGCRLSFYDWCMNHLKADRRRKGSSKREMAGSNRERTIAAMLIGWLTWGVAVYWASGQRLTVGASAIIGAVISGLLLRWNRRLAGFTLIILPSIVAYFATR